MKAKLKDWYRVWDGKNATAFRRHVNLRKLLNLLRVEYEKKRGIARVKGLPYTMTVDVTNACNLRCPFCPTGRQEYGRKKQNMPLDQFKHIVDHLRDMLLVVNLFNWGEPLVHPHIWDMVGYLTENNIGSGISTNLNLLDEEGARRMVSCGLEYLGVSGDGVSQEAYAKYRVRGNVDTVFRNIELVVRERERHRTRYPRIHWEYLVHKFNEHEIQLAREKAGELGVDHIHFHALDCEDPSWLPQDPKFRSLRGGYNQPTDRNRSPAGVVEVRARCHYLWHSVTFGADGGVAPCCMTYFKEDDFASLDADSDFRSIWNNDKYVRARRMFSDDPLKIAPEHADVCCNRCLVTMAWQRVTPKDVGQSEEEAIRVQKEEGIVG
ncbi:MAG: radical SAM protein [Phycisphaerales bacterium]|nr:MAG: radical SAM protein [Phycisphaerales bacterium]